MYKKSPAKLWRRQQEHYQNKGKAKLLTWSEVHAAAEGFERYLPYVIAIVEFSDKTRSTVQLVDVKTQLRQGLWLEPVYRRVYADNDAGVIHYAVKYRPLQK